MNALKRNNILNGMSKRDISLETIETLSDIVTLYSLTIQENLDQITSNPVLQAQIKESLGIN
jgi:hypothetical protein